MNQNKQDPIAEMSPEEITEACCTLLGLHYSDSSFLLGAMIERLQEWKCDIYWDYCHSAWEITYPSQSYCLREKSLPEAFLRTAQVLGHYKIKVKEEFWYLDKDERQIYGPYHSYDQAAVYLLNIQRYERITPHPYPEEPA